MACILPLLFLNWYSGNIFSRTFTDLFISCVSNLIFSLNNKHVPIITVQTVHVLQL